MRSLTLAIVQFPRSDNPEKNAACMAHYLSQIAPDTDLVLLPEDWLGPAVVDFAAYLKIVENLVAEMGNRRSLLVSGAQYVRCGELIHSRGIFWGGELDAPVFFEKLFPSQAIGERDFIAPGTLLPVVEYRGVKVGAVVCVDLMYPEIARRLALEGAALILNPANIPISRMPLWHAVGISRACENTVFVAMANNTATSYADGREVMGESFLAPPDGYGFVSCGREPGIFYFQLDLERISRVRQRWPYLQDVAGLTRPPIPVFSFPGRP